MTYIVLRLVAVAGACLWLASGEQIAHATATSANVDSTRLVRLGGTRYRYVEGSLNGTIAHDDGSPDFRALRSKRRGHEAVLYAFDLIEHDGDDLAACR